MKSLKIGKIFDIPVYLHISFLIMFGIVLLMNPKSVLFLLMIFGVVVIHELSHALTARRFGVGTQNITLYPIGGIARLDYIPKEPKKELLIAIAGPFINGIMAVIAFGILIFIPQNTYWFKLMSNFVAINLVLGLFNLIPAFPLDGGRIFRSLLVKKYGHMVATKKAAAIGRCSAVGLAVLGITGILSPMVILVAIFIWLAGSTEEQDVVRSYYITQSNRWR